MLKQLALATFAATALLAVQSAANAGPRDCDEFGCGGNGTQLTGIAGQTSETASASRAVAAVTTGDAARTAHGSMAARSRPNSPP